MLMGLVYIVWSIMRLDNEPRTYFFLLVDIAFVVVLSCLIGCFLSVR